MPTIKLNQLDNVSNQCLSQEQIDQHIQRFDVAGQVLGILNENGSFKKDFEGLDNCQAQEKIEKLKEGFEQIVEASTKQRSAIQVYPDETESYDKVMSNMSNMIKEEQKVAVTENKDFKNTDEYKTSVLLKTLGAVKP